MLSNYTQLISNTNIDFPSGTQIALPDYVFSLPHEEVTNIINSPKASLKIVACGTDPKDGHVTLVTGKGDVLIFKPEQFHIPPGYFLPMFDGDLVDLPNSPGRWPEPIKGYQVDSIWLIERSRSAIEDASLQIGHIYRNEDYNPSTSQDNP